MNIIRKTAIALTVAAGITAATAGTANALSTDEYDNVRYWWCGNGVATLEWTNVYGNTSEQTVDLSSGCRKYDFTETGEYGGFAAASVTDSNGGPVSCKVWINGRVAANSNDNSDYYSYASCY